MIKAIRSLSIAALLFLAGCDAQSASYDSIYWSDGDSGRIGSQKFRLANVDAPETGGVGSRGGANCESERALGYKAKAFMVSLTRGKTVTITKRNGKDRYGRFVVNMSVNGEDIAARGLEAGHLKRWPHMGGKALAPKPNWCE